MNDNGISNEESEEIITYLKDVRIPASRSGYFSNKLLNILKMNKSILVPNKISPVAAVKSLNHAVRKEYNKIPKEMNIVFKRVLNENGKRTVTSRDNVKTRNIDDFIKSENFKKTGLTEDNFRHLAETFRTENNNRNIFEKSRFTKNEIEKISAAKAFKETGIDREKITDTFKELNSFNRSKSVSPELNFINTFAESENFKKSGLNYEQLSNLFNMHKKAYSGLERNYLKKMPLKFNEKQSGFSDNIEMPQPLQAKEAGQAGNINKT